MRSDLKMVALIMMGVVAVLSRAEGWADTLVLKNGNTIEGEVTDKNNNYVAIITSDNNGAKTYYLANRVDTVNGQPFSQFRLVKNKLLNQKFSLKKGQKNPLVSLILKDGKTIKGQLVDRNDQYFRIIPEGSDRVEEYLIENIAKAE